MCSLAGGLLLHGASSNELSSRASPSFIVMYVWITLHVCCLPATARCHGRLLQLRAHRRLSFIPYLVCSELKLLPGMLAKACCIRLNYIPSVLKKNAVLWLPLAIVKRARFAGDCKTLLHVLNGEYVASLSGAL